MDYTHFNPVKHALVATRQIGRIRHFAGDWRGGSDEPQQTGEWQ
jgi:hypothetical protein